MGKKNQTPVESGEAAQAAEGAEVNLGVQAEGDVGGEAAGEADASSGAEVQPGADAAPAGEAAAGESAPEQSAADREALKDARRRVRTEPVFTDVTEDYAPPQPKRTMEAMFDSLVRPPQSFGVTGVSKMAITRAMNAAYQRRKAEGDESVTYRVDPEGDGFRIFRVA